jgi:hypothetical protein
VFPFPRHPPSEELLGRGKVAEEEGAVHSIRGETNETTLEPHLLKTHTLVRKK